MEENKTKFIDVLPITKWKRFLAFLADFFINFILSFTLFNLVCFPIASEVIHKNDLYQERYNYICKSNDIFIDNGLLFAKYDKDRTDFDKCLKYTFDCFLSCFVIDDYSSINIGDDNFKNGVKNDIFLTYYSDIKNDVETYSNLFAEYNQKYEYFIEGSPFVLKNDVKIQLIAYFDLNDEMTKTGEIIYKNIQESIFLSIYGNMVDDIKINDLTSEGYSYLDLDNKVNAINNKLNYSVSISSIISFVISSFVLYLLIPLVNKNHKTIAMFAMRIERVGVNNVYLLNKKETSLIFVYHFVLDMFMILLLPNQVVPFAYLFNLPILLPLFILSFALVLISLGFLLFNSFNKTLLDFLSRSVLITTNSLDEIYRSRGYDI